ncbi:uncharacterized protein LOC125013952 [Mugil cephalus]|uniref:uncharacterized protein LOC125013952 n=1 Tax=Mugil cephalus TaxID=48193 RepID=UPI001FB5925C|nr:uncharacterized protein LOC125013952 [Mugil cephalus]
MNCFSVFSLLLVPCCRLSDVSESILQSMQRSRRLLFVLSPDFLAEKSFSLLECRLGLYLHHGRRASIVCVTLRSVSKLPCVEVAQLRQAAASSVSWRGGRSEPRRSRFWLRLRLALPVRPLALGRRLIDSTSSHSDLAAAALQRVHHQNQNQNQNRSDAANQSRRHRRINQSRRGRVAPPRGRGSVKRAGSCKKEEEPQHSRRCSGCAGFMGPVVDRGAVLTVGGGVQQSDSAHNAQHTPSPAPVPDLTSDLDADSAPSTCKRDDAETQQQPQQVIGSRTSEEIVKQRESPAPFQEKHQQSL